MIRRILPPAILLFLSACATVAVPPPAPDPVTIRIAGINDFHGNLQPLKTPKQVRAPDGEVVTVPVGGAAWLASTIAAVRAQSPYSMVISAGDMIGASPLASAAFLDEPTIGVMNRIGVDFNALGNHEFDKGWHELKRIADGGCEKYTLRQPCAVEPDFAGADFPFLSANVVTDDGETLFAPYGLKTFGTGAGEVTVGVIGLPLRDVPNLVTPSGVVDLTFGDEADAINIYAQELASQGADAIVVAIHQGLYTEEPADADGCAAISGDLLGILTRLDPRIDLVISGHTHWSYVCDFSTIDPTRPFLVTSAGYGGSQVTDIALTIDPASGEVTGRSAHNMTVQSEGKAKDGSAFATSEKLERFAPDTGIAAYVAQYIAAVADVEKRPVGRVAGDGTITDDDEIETALGDMIADAQLAATREAGAQIAFMNNSGVRASLVPAVDGTVTFGDIYAVQPFGNTLVTRTMTGDQILALLEQQFEEGMKRQILAPSSGFAFAYDRSRAEGDRIVSATLDGDPVNPLKSYRVTMNSFLAAGGDGFKLFTEGTQTTTGGNDLDAMEAWIAAAPLRQLPAANRVSNLTPR
ncbi:bifunctional metallophosphatase/5'-nucleotidase [Croceicoccus bisphenolivorans]|uniref:bifunctional metallophosphatase/5'-nucleotidase n=1 Tax=Croceicoccus bisphenolivorans TaxID=1783232 RepID=UPI00082EC22B|nr:bifunctional metallophosphatase/5'-nucleotidase [Croceicoccus bisphenolivorans]